MVEFLANWISIDGSPPFRDKTKTTTERLLLKTLHDLRFFLGLASYYRMYVAEFASIATP